MFAPEYAAEIFVNLQKRELDFLVKDYLKDQIEITETMRAILIDWLVEVRIWFQFFNGFILVVGGSTEFRIFTFYM